MIVEGSFIDNQNSFGESLTVFNHKEIFIMGAVEDGDDVFHLSFHLLLVHLFPQLKITVYGQELFDLNCHLGLEKGMLNAIFVVRYKISYIVDGL